MVQSQGEPHHLEGVVERRVRVEEGEPAQDQEGKDLDVLLSL